jgi:hypothetical protein
MVRWPQARLSVPISTTAIGMSSVWECSIQKPDDFRTAILAALACSIYGIRRPLSVGFSEPTARLAAGITYAKTIYHSLWGTRCRPGHVHLLIVEVLLQSIWIVRFGKCEHQENARFLGTEVVGEDVSDSLEGQC